MDENGKSELAVKKKFVKLILQLKENHHMNESGTSLISSTLIEILDWFLDELKAKLVQETPKNHAEAVSLVKQQGRKLIMNSPLLEVNTEHKIKKYLLEKCGLVPPQEITLGKAKAVPKVELSSKKEKLTEMRENESYVDDLNKSLKENEDVNEALKRNTLGQQKKARKMMEDQLATLKCELNKQQVN
ncbi:Hypothetical predicted protein [Cloeon dipterum]|uniref:Uncharacterized protein n=1 Tax=Cloeon dipterum TaxID=197152 RepID=A0A8S1D2S1_9INSE|nr:Hypothetical predicted protein [Cloeon dipterum]